MFESFAQRRCDIVDMRYFLAVIYAFATSCDKNHKLFKLLQSRVHRLNVGINKNIWYR